MIGIVIALLVLVFLAVLVVRAMMFQPKPQAEVRRESVSFDKDAAVSALQQLVRCKTVSNVDPSLEDDAEFEKLIGLLPDLYPDIWNACTFTRFPDRGILLHWKGKSADKPSVMMAHYDVVPVDDAYLWDKDPFCGDVEDGVLWGRGTLDTKITMSSALSAANNLVKQGFLPENDVYFAFSGGEEVNGKGAANIVAYFQEKGITPELVLDEGGAVVENVFPGVNVPCGMIGIAEKGMINVRYSVVTTGGHASAPLPKTPILSLSNVCRNVIGHPFPMKLSEPTALLFDTLGRHSTFLYKLIFANLWCFMPVLDLICKKSGGEINALVRTTTAFTQMEGSPARNVLPAEAHMISNMRLNPGDTVQGAVEYLHKVAADKDVKIIVLEGNEPSRISQVDCDSYRKVAAAVSATWDGCLTSPYLMVQCSDSRHYGAISDKVYRFSAMDLTKEERGSIHGNNERIRLDTLYRSVEFYIRLLKQC